MSGPPSCFPVPLSTVSALIDAIDTDTDTDTDTGPAPAPCMRKGEHIMRSLSVRRIFLACAAALWIAPVANAAQIGSAGNVYLAGGDVRIATPVAADLLAAGGRVSVEGDVGADAAVAGGSVDIRAPVSQDLRAAAGSLTIERNVGADLVAAGGTVKIDGAAQVAGAAWLAGRELDVAGRVGKGARLYGDRIVLSGQITGDTSMYGREIVLAPTARIDGNLSYASESALPDSQRAQVSGTITRLEAPPGWEQAETRGNAWSWFHPLFIVSMLICGMLLHLLFPKAVDGVGRAIAQYPMRSVLIGIALLFAVPPVAILFLATVVGLPIGFALLLLYPLSLLLGYLATAFFIGQKIAGALKQTEPAAEPLTSKKQALFLALSLLVLSIALALPFLGGFILILAVVTGLGGWAVWAQSQYGKRKDAGTSPQHLTSGGM